ncbi:MAG TPA: hypothetical protein VG797_09500 [Phycisphaerales bacterium]|nr:hypothetical protein [Phycisphaerales bacterium]
MTNDQLRQALRELNGERHLAVVFHGVHSLALGSVYLEIKHAMLVPQEEDHLVKVTDGKSIYIIDAAQVAWLKIG